MKRDGFGDTVRQTDRKGRYVADGGGKSGGLKYRAPEVQILPGPSSLLRLTRIGRQPLTLEMMGFESPRSDHAVLADRYRIRPESGSRRKRREGSTPSDSVSSCKPNGKAPAWKAGSSRVTGVQVQVLS